VIESQLSLHSCLVAVVVVFPWLHFRFCYHTVYCGLDVLDGINVKFVSEVTISQDLRLNIMLGPSCDGTSAAVDVIFPSTTLTVYD